MNKEQFLEIFLSCFYKYQDINKTLIGVCIENDIDVGYIEIFFPNGEKDLIEEIDAKIALKLEEKSIDVINMRVRDRIKYLVKERLLLHQGLENHDILMNHMNDFLEKKCNMMFAMKFFYNIASDMWYIAGDTTTDFNFYTKRALLGRICRKVFKCFANDFSENKVETWMLLDTEIENIMKIQRCKSVVQKEISTFKDFASSFVKGIIP